MNSIFILLRFYFIYHHISCNCKVYHHHIPNNFYHILNTCCLLKNNFVNIACIFLCYQIIGIIDIFLCCIIYIYESQLSNINHDIQYTYQPIQCMNNNCYRIFANNFFAIDLVNNQPYIKYTLLISIYNNLRF